MNILKKIISVNTLILCGALAFLVAGIHQLTEAYYPGQLIPHTGVVETKTIDSTEIRDKMQVPTLFLKLSGDPTIYRASRYVDLIDRSLHTGDSVELYTKEVTSKIGNSVVDETGGRLWTTNNPNEIFHLVAIRENSTLIDSRANQHDLKTTVWIFPLCSLLFMGWFFYRRSGLKSIFITGSSI
jgi:hypothetical protein